MEPGKNCRCPALIIYCDFSVILWYSTIIRKCYFRRNKYFIKGALLAIAEFIKMHEEHHVSAISCSNAHAKSKKKTTATNAEDKKIKKRLRDPEVVESMEKPLEEALVYLNHLLKIGEYCAKFKNCSTA